IFFGFFIFAAFFRLNNSVVLLTLENNMMAYADVYVLIVLVPFSLIATFWRLRSIQIPKILKQQIKILIKYFVIPTFIVDFVQVYPFTHSLSVLTQTLSVVGLSTIALTLTIYYSARRVMGLRFLNFDEHIISLKKVDYRKNLKTVFDQLEKATNERELIYITQNFFKDAFAIQTNSTHFYIRNRNDSRKNPELTIYDSESEQVLVENFINSCDERSSISKFLKKQKIIVADELTFSNFYKQNESRERILAFLCSINADIFISVYHREEMVACIVIGRNARIQEFHNGGEFYSDVECYHMELFANHLGNTIQSLHNKSLKTLVAKNRELIAKTKELKEELYNQHQKNNQYKEAFRMFMRGSSRKKIGMMRYQTRRFVFCNPIAQDFVQVNPNAYIGHPVVKALKNVVKQVIEYKTQQTCFVKDPQGQELTLSAFPSDVEHNNHVTIFLYHADISDVLKNKIDLIDDPSTWDYFLYLETTKSGKFINKLISGSSPTLLNFKIDLLKIALSKKAILIDMHDEDLMPTIEILHHISLREKLHVLDLRGSSKSGEEIAIELLGMNHLFGGSQESKRPVFEMLDGIGTLFIKDIHLLDVEVQEYIAELLKYGCYRKFKTTQKIECDVRIICSTDCNLSEMVREGMFSKMLFDELNKTKLVLPSLETLSKKELQNLVTDMGDQKLKNTTTKNVLEFSDKEKKNLIRTTALTSLYDLKRRVDLLIEKKMREAGTFDVSHTIDSVSLNEESQELAEAMRLGRYALKDKNLMTFMWNAFKSQNKIAKLLDVNPSSVNRRLKEYSLIS
ncbi:sigma 54-interacting transcriptional regulator, partial [bacterium]|nr:sigma 54-interacting transcriptional regulator [bacterium]